MIYVIGDIHGCKDKYDEMLLKLSPGEKDAVFVLGDVLDVGDDGIGILMDMMYQANIYPVLGEREYYAKKLLGDIADCGGTEKALEKLEGEKKELLLCWKKLGCDKTVDAFLKLSEDDREAVLDYLEEFNAYEELECNGKKFVLCHAGIRNFDEQKALDDYSEEDFVSEKADYGRIYFKDAYLVTGHTPTVAIGKEFAGKIYSKKRHIALDCGAAFGGRLAALCLDTLKVFYC